MIKERLNIFRTNKKKVLVISGGWFRGVYALGILKRLEELGMKKDIEAVFWVSIGAVIGSLRTNGISAQEIFDEMLKMKFTEFYALNILKFNFKSLVSHKPIENLLKKHLPSRIKDVSDTKIPFYIGACDISSAKFIFFEKGDIIPLTLASMSIPWIYQSIKYKEYDLVDGGVVNSFPVNHVKKIYPHHKFIGINLNKFKPNLHPKNIFEVLLQSFNIMQRSRSYEQNHLVDWLFFRELDIKLLDFDKKKLQTAFDQGYKDCEKMFK